MQDMPDIQVVETFRKEGWRIAHIPFLKVTVAVRDRDQKVRVRGGGYCPYQGSLSDRPIRMREDE